MTPRTMKLWTAVFALLLFSSGVAVGMIVQASLLPSGPRGFRGGPPRLGGPLRPGRDVLADRLASELKLSADQRAELDEIFARRRGRLEGFHAQVRARFETEQRELREDIRKILTPEQQRLFDEWLQRQPPDRPPGRPRGRPPGRPPF
ncbi:MAG: hypothetical protein HYX76_10750 [Acidobacteria bacterium]|nr:hypothetical protein [Acidobacteriota bacterium]